MSARRIRSMVPFAARIAIITHSAETHQISKYRLAHTQHMRQGIRCTNSQPAMDVQLRSPTPTRGASVGDCGQHPPTMAVKIKLKFDFF
jgi:hypothetical protein